METVVVTLLVGLALIIAYMFFGKEQKLKKYEEIEKGKAVSVFFQQEISRMGNLEVVGVGSDGNSDVEFIQAVKKITLPNDVRVQIYD